MRRSVLYSIIATIVLLPVLGVFVVKTLASDGETKQSLASGPPPGPYRGSEPPPGIFAPDFTLTSYRGNVVRMQSLRGKVVLVTFLDTDCKTKCPLIASAVGDGLRLLSSSDRRRVVPLALTVNPPSDTPASIRRFLRERKALGLDFLLGTTKQMRPVWRAFHVLSAAETGNADIHSADVRVYDRAGEWVSTMHLPPDLTPKNLAHDIRVALHANLRG
jgi:cytochrome oxidase Cu insertion factor (SCO1/SenC/PrrC family)